MEPAGFGVRLGEIVAARYRVESVLGQGGFGAVFLATQLNLDRKVALKVLLPHLTTSEESRVRFEQEARLAQRLTHPNTVRLFDLGTTDGGLPFIAWEYLDGRALDSVLRAEGRLSPARVARVAIQVLGSLAEAHAHGIVHRDIKPSNVFLCPFAGEPDFTKVLDFGIAKAAGAGGGAPMTQVGMAVGTPSYMAPEQAMAQEVSPGTDLYALGLVMAEALTGEVVFRGETPMAIFMQQASDDAVPLPPEVRAGPLGPVIATAVEKDPLRRYPSAEAMRAAVEAVLPRLADVPSPTARSGVVASAPPASPSLVYGATQGAPVAHAPFGTTSVAVVDPTRRSPVARPAPKALPIALGLAALALVVGVGALAVALRGDARRSRGIREGDHPGLFAGETEETEAPTVGGPAKEPCRLEADLDGVDPGRVSKRVTRAGWKVVDMSVLMATTSWQLEADGDRAATVVLFQMPDRLSAELVVEDCGTPIDADTVYARDGKTVLQVDVFDDQAEAERLLDTILE